jgi:hypothetical protein
MVKQLKKIIAWEGEVSWKREGSFYGSVKWAAQVGDIEEESRVTRKKEIGTSYKIWGGRRQKETLKRR